VAINRRERTDIRVTRPIPEERRPLKRIFIPTKTGSDWQSLLAKPELHWKKGASAMTAAAA